MLMQLQECAEMWKRADAILEGGKLDNTRFFGLSILEARSALPFSPRASRARAAAAAGAAVGGARPRAEGSFSEHAKPQRPACRRQCRGPCMAMRPCTAQIPYFPVQSQIIYLNETEVESWEEAMVRRARSAGDDEA